MLKDMVANISILVSMLFLGSQFFKNNAINRSSSFNHRVLLGIMGGLSCIMLMIYEVRLNDIFVLDNSIIPEVLITLTGGAVSIIVMVVLSIIFRLSYFGVSNYYLIASLGTIAASMGCIAVVRLKASNTHKCIYMFLWCLCVRTVIFSYLATDVVEAMMVIVSMWYITIIVGALLCYLAQYLADSQRIMLQLKENALKDFLTGLYNSRSFDDYFNTILKRAVEKDEKLSFLMLDIDYFKKVNDTYGHLAGDMILKEFATLVKTTCRTYDVASRMGGEEFSVILPKCPLINALEVAERIRANVENHQFQTDDNVIIRITVSIGAASYPETVGRAEDIIQKADAGLYKAKHIGRNRVCVI